MHNDGSKSFSFDTVKFFVEAKQLIRISAFQSPGVTASQRPTPKPKKLCAAYRN
jgi:hypothetical protein